MQLPDAGDVLDPGSDRVRLVLAVAIDQVPTVTMPSLIGLSADEVATVLNQLGLVLGRTTVRSLQHRLGGANGTATIQLEVPLTPRA